jgi:hypothetical protein
MRVHPWADPTVLKETHLSLTMHDGDEFELGDSWYNITHIGRAYLFIKSTDYGGAVTFRIGYKPLFAQWVLILCASIGGVVVIGCLFICCWYVRKKAAQKAEEETAQKVTTTKVKKFSNTEQDKISKLKYGRESKPIDLPELGEIEDEMHKP